MTPHHTGHRHRLLHVAILAALATAPASGLATAPAMPQRDPARKVFAELPRTPTHLTGATTNTWVVSNCHDWGAGSLRDALSLASDGDHIDLSQLHCNTINLDIGAIPIMVSSITLAGPANGNLTLRGNGNERVLFHPFGGTLTLQHLTISHGADIVTGFNVAGGGCIASAGYLVLQHTIIRDCLASGEAAYGGALYAYSLTMHDSTITSNRAWGNNLHANTAAWGGGAFVYQLSMYNSSIQGNTASNNPQDGHTSTDLGGGVVVIRGADIHSSAITGNYSYGRGGGLASLASVSIGNSTIAGNEARHGNGGGLFLRRPSTLRLVNSTLSGNLAPAGAGMALYTPQADVTSSIIADNSSGSIHSNDPLQIVGSHNLIDSASATVTLPADTLTGPAQLGPPGTHGGSTVHLLPLPGSPAIDAGSNPDSYTWDQRGDGYPRSIGPAPDIGAIEAHPQTAAATPVPAAHPGWMTLLAWLLAILALRPPGRQQRS